MKFFNGFLLILNTLLLFAWILLLIFLQGAIGILPAPDQLSFLASIPPVVFNLVLLSYFSLMEIILLFNFLRRV